MIAELGQRPALNGGWERLAGQQDEQCRDLKRVRSRLRKAETWIARWDLRWKILMGFVAPTATAVVAKIVLEILVRAKLIP